MTFTLPGATVQHDHGTRSRYVKGCRCSKCRAANLAAYHEREARSKEAAAAIPPTKDGRCPGIEGKPCPTSTRLRPDSTVVCCRCRKRLVWNGLVDAKPARKHLRRLSRRGVGSRAIRDASDVGRTTLCKIRSGEKRRIRKSTADAILAVDLGAVADHGIVSAGMTWQRIRELEVEYLGAANLARALGYRSAKIQIGRKRILAKTELRIRRFYEQAGGPFERSSA